MPLLIYALIVLFTFIILSNIVSWFTNQSSSNSVVEGMVSSDDGDEDGVKPNASNSNSLEIQTQDNTTNIATNTANIATNTTNIASLQSQVNGLSQEIANAGSSAAGGTTPHNITGTTTDTDDDATTTSDTTTD